MMVGGFAHGSDFAVHSPTFASDPIRVVVHYADGKVVKGTTQDFYPNKPTFHLFPGAGEPSAGAIQLRMKDLKAVVFVRDLAGADFFTEPHTASEGKHAAGQKVEVTFVDGHVLIGTTLGYDPRRPGFFITPLDPHGNTLRVFVVSEAVTRVHQL